MALSLTITDNADGTGAVAAVAGATGTVTIYTQTFSGDLGAGLWASAGSRSGDGTVTLSLANGHYFTYASDGSEASPVVYATITDGVAAVCHRIDLAVQARLQILGLAGIPNERVVVRDAPTDRNVTNPCIIVSPSRQTMDPKAGVLSYDDVVYSEQVTIFDQEDKTHANGAKYKLWLQKIARAFRNQTLTGVTEVFTCEVVPGPTIPPADWLANKYVGALILKFTAREPRGI